VRTIKQNGVLKKQTKSLHVTSELSNIRMVVAELLAFVNEKTGVQEEILPTVLSEALTNAIVHGNGSDPEKKVFAQVWVTPRKMSFKVRDEGAGFDYSQLPDPTKPGNLMKTSGRGLFFVQHLMDNVYFRKSGSEITMEKYIQTPESN
jgi:serine/threonine-protein kinase RsbW